MWPLEDDRIYRQILYKNLVDSLDFSIIIFLLGLLLSDFLNLSIL